MFNNLSIKVHINRLFLALSGIIKRFKPDSNISFITPEGSTYVTQLENKPRKTSMGYSGISSSTL